MPPIVAPRAKKPVFMIAAEAPISAVMSCFNWRMESTHSLLFGPSVDVVTQGSRRHLRNLHRSRSTGRRGRLSSVDVGYGSGAHARAVLNYRSGDRFGARGPQPVALSELPDEMRPRDGPVDRAWSALAVPLYRFLAYLARVSAFACMSTPRKNLVRKFMDSGSTYASADRSNRRVSGAIGTRGRVRNRESRQRPEADGSLAPERRQRVRLTGGAEFDPDCPARRAPGRKPPDSPRTTSGVRCMPPSVPTTLSIRWFAARPRQSDLRDDLNATAATRRSRCRTRNPATTTPRLPVHDEQVASAPTIKAVAAAAALRVKLTSITIRA